MPVAGDDWYQRRRRDAEGEFLRAVADQGPRKSGTRQGIYTLTASGKLLSYRNAQDAATMREAIEAGLKRFRALPEAERKAGAVSVPEHGKADAAYVRTPPEGGLILRSFTRILDRDPTKGYTRGTCDFSGGDQAARDYVWLKKDEWRALIPDRPRTGEAAALPEALVRRLCRFHLLDNTRGEPTYWKADEVKRAELTAKVVAADEETLTLELNGSALMKAEERGFDAALHGQIRVDRRKGAVTAFDLMAVGDHWGRGAHTPGEREGKQPLGIVFELVTGDAAADRVPPQGVREIEEYFRAR